MPSSIKICFDTEAHSQLLDKHFLEQWEHLLRACPWATPFQGSGFVNGWYECYKDQYSPVVITEFDEQGGLRGLLTLAKDITAGRLVVAGAPQAEYQSWLAREEHSTHFITEAWKLMTSKFPGRELTFKYLPPGLNPQSLKTSALYSVVYSRLRVRPLMRVSCERLRASFGKKSNKSRFNRLKRLGEVRFECITEEQRFTEVLEDTIPYYDFRQGAVNNQCPFHEDPRKKRFLIALFKVPDLLHVSVLRVGDNVTSAHIGLMDRDTVYLGILPFSPYYTRHSVGKLHLMLLGQKLMEQGLKLLDLTPGDDPFKERFANANDTVYELTLQKGRVAAIVSAARRKSTEIIKTIAKLVKITPSDVRTIFSKLKRLRLQWILRKLWRLIRQEVEYRVYCQTWDSLQAVESEGLMNKDSIADLLKFEPSEPWQNRQDFLKRAMHRLENGEHVYTFVQDGKLLHHAWLVERQKKALFSEVKSELEYPDGTAVLYDSYTHPDAWGKGLQQMSVKERLVELQKLTDVKYVYTSVLADNLPSRHVIEKFGFEYQCSLFYSRWLWIESKRTVEA